MHAISLANLCLRITITLLASKISVTSEFTSSGHYMETFTSYFTTVKPNHVYTQHVQETKKCTT